MAQLDKDKSVDAVNAFCTYWLKQGKADMMQKGDVKVTASVTYHFGKNYITDTTEVYFVRSRTNDGEIKVTETDSLLAEEVHLLLSKNYQQYSYDKETHLLEVTGNSPEKLGHYRVSIRVT